MAGLTLAILALSDPSTCESSGLTNCAAEFAHPHHLPLPPDSNFSWCSFSDAIVDLKRTSRSQIPDAMLQCITDEWTVYSALSSMLIYDRSTSY